MTTLAHVDGRVAQRAVELTFEAAPAYAAALTSVGRRRCEEDALFHVRFLVAALAVDDSTIFSDYVAWARELLAHYDVESRHLAAMLECIAQATSELAADDAGSVRVYVDEAKAVLA